jgi:FKBP-type peptidyl-prolyl cis-trans isomerase FkpA
VIPKGKLTDQAFNEEITKYMKGLADVQKNAEPAKLQKYLDDNKIKANKTDSGLYYVITQQGQGPLIAPNDTAVINYVGRQLNGKVFDTSIKAEGIKAKLTNIDQRPFKPIPVVIGQKKVIEGWDTGLRLLNKGAKATFIIPSKLAYGAMGAGPIAPYTPIVFDLEVVDVIHPKPGSLAPAPPTAAVRK